MKDLAKQLQTKTSKMQRKHLTAQKPLYNSPEEYRAWQNAQAALDSKRIAFEAKRGFATAMMRESDVALNQHTFANFNAEHEWQHSLIEQAGEYVNGLIKGDGDLNLVICGEYGSGKTHLACAIVNHFANETGGVGLAKQFNALIRILWNRKEDPKLAESTRYHALNVEILFIDEVGAAERELYDSQISELGEIIRTRVNNNKPTIITSNWAAKEFSQQIDSFAFGGLRQGGLTVFEIPKHQGRDQRKKVKFTQF